MRSGFEDLIVAGGVESMSRVPMASDGGAWAMDPETNLKTSFVPQGIGADLIATLEGFSREDVDAYALESQTRAAKSWADGAFDRSIVPVVDRNGLIVLDRDEHMRETTMEGLSGLKPSFAGIGDMGGFDAVALQKYHWVEAINHVHHGGNSSGHRRRRRAGAARVPRRPASRTASPRAPAIVATAVSGADPTIMLTGPTPACEKVLAKAGMTVDDIDLLEINEAFAAVPMKLMKDLGFPHERTNVAGGAIALGHPLGATGAMLVGTMVDELERRDLRRALVTLCIGGGMGVATIIERV